jgi:hypothetical protein
MSRVETATLRACRYCNHAVAIHARRCPNCGAGRPDSAWRFWLNTKGTRVMLTVIAVIVVLSAIVLARA